jgi:hypothetical protein
MRQTVAKLEKSALCGGGARSTPHPGWGAFSTVASRSVRRKPTYLGLAGMTLDYPADRNFGATTPSIRSRPLVEPRRAPASKGEIDHEAIEHGSSGHPDVF